jgi:peptide/nickel transport system ATP-binding protein
MDEPTTGLDVVTQASVLTEIQRLRHELGVAIVYVTHNLAVVASIADEIAVMYAGRIVETGPAAEVLRTPRHPYTRGLVSSIPDFRKPRRLRGIGGVAVGVGGRPPGCAYAPRCDQRRDPCEVAPPPLEEVGPAHRVRCLEWRRTPMLELAASGAAADALGARVTALLAVDSLRAVHRARAGDVVAASDVSFSIARGEAVALVGESGSGKTTIGRCISGLHPPAAGRILLDGAVLAPRANQRSRGERQQIQIVFQNPYDTLNPRTRIIDEVARPARLLRGIGRRQSLADAGSLLEQVQLPQRLAQRYPAELSGGERQRVAIARALAAEPALLICDEITSALDVSVQATVIELLANLREQLGLALLFISHDLGVVANVASRALVLESGIVREQGVLSDVLGHPQDDYTKRLIAAAPRLSMEGTP